MELRDKTHVGETGPAEEALQSELDRLEAAFARKDAELARARAESGLKDLLINEMQDALARQEKVLSRLQSRIEEVERRLSATILRL